jgi:hypothetical protein
MFNANSREYCKQLVNRKSRLYVAYCASYVDMKMSSVLRQYKRYTATEDCSLVRDSRNFRSW